MDAKIGHSWPLNATQLTSDSDGRVDDVTEQVELIMTLSGDTAYILSGECHVASVVDGTGNDVAAGRSDVLSSGKRIIIRIRLGETHHKDASKDPKYTEEQDK